MTVRIGTAGWSIPRVCAAGFPADGSSLSRYAARFNAVEINSSFHRSHRRSTWQRWSESVPPGFRFSVKLPKLITHIHKLVDCPAHIDAFVEEAKPLAGKLAVMLVQLPPKLALDVDVAADFFRALATRTEAIIVCEPRHPSWFTAEADTLLREFQIARVAADPAICDAAAKPGGWPGLRYWRLHGSPVVYRSSYRDRVGDYAAKLLEGDQAADSWCIFDNTASAAGAGDALALQQAMRRAAQA